MNERLVEQSYCLLLPSQSAETKADAWRVQAAIFPKIDFEIWFAQQPRLK